MSTKQNQVVTELAELIEISRAVGVDPDLVQGGGGNTSVKSRGGSSIFVKASGTALAEMDADRGWAELDLDGVRRLLEAPGLAEKPEDEREREVLRLLQSTVRRPAEARPSVESSLHAILDRVVIHTHPVGLNAFLCCRDSARRYREIIGDVVVKRWGEPLYVPYVDPGYTLAKRLESDIRAYRDSHSRLPAVVLLENHGLFVAADEAKDCLSLSKKLCELGQKWIGGERINSKEFPALENAGLAKGLAELRGALLNGGCAPLLVRRDASKIAADFLTDGRRIEAAKRGAFTPDQIVYCRTFPLILSPRREGGAHRGAWEKAIASYRERFGVDPRVLIVPGEGIYYTAPNLAQLRVVAEIYRSAMTAIIRSAKGGGPRFLSRQQSRFIEGWEVERFRGALAAGEPAALAGRVAVVTGGAKPAGEVAASLARAGALVVRFAAGESEASPSPAAAVEAGVFALPVPNGDVDQERRAFGIVEASFGGLDVLVECPDEAPPESGAKAGASKRRKSSPPGGDAEMASRAGAAELFRQQDAGGLSLVAAPPSGRRKKGESKTPAPRMPAAPTAHQALVVERGEVAARAAELLKRRRAGTPQAPST
jgi:rhamnose utilization protein RhaD (predicted bifunctional aldolase and dehydrogenase)